jgi:hypothetical protein
MSVFNNLAADMPPNDGSASRAKVLMREGSIVGKPPVVAIEGSIDRARSPFVSREAQPIDIMSK